MRLIAWLARAALFLLLFALALNNLHEVNVRGLFGTEWSGPMIVVILVSFACGAVLALVSLWPPTHRRRGQPAAPDKETASRRPAESPEGSNAALSRDGL